MQPLRRHVLPPLEGDRARPAPSPLQRGDRRGRRRRHEGHPAEQGARRVQQGQAGAAVCRGGARGGQDQGQAARSRSRCPSTSSPSSPRTLPYLCSTLQIAKIHLITDKVEGPQPEVQANATPGKPQPHFFSEDLAASRRARRARHPPPRQPAAAAPEASRPSSTTSRASAPPKS